MGRLLKLPDEVRRDVLAYRGHVERFVRGEVSPTVFRAYRVPMGVYEQRAAGKYMVRVRIGAGRVSSKQLECIARLSRLYGNGVVHVTTRQDLQIHEVSIEHTPDVMEELLQVGLSSRGGGGNTVRNVTTCARSGVCAQEQFDVADYALATAEYLLQFDSSYNLPRKYKIAFSGCSEDCAFASVADLGFFAHVRDGVQGFSVHAAGGLGANPAVGVRIEDFVGTGEILEVAEAVKRLFDEHGDRSNKHRARLRYVLARLGPAEFVRLYRRHRENVATQGLPGKVPTITPRPSIPDAAADPAQANGSPKRYLLPEKRGGFYTVRLTLPLGDISCDDLIQLAQIAAGYGPGIVRTTQQQDLLICSVPRTSLAAVTAALGNLSVDVLGNGVPKIVTCAGASTCKLGLCLSRGLAEAISERVADLSALAMSRTTIRISGCPNSCGHHTLGDLGFQGRAKRVDGRLMPCYDILTGARTVEGQARLAERIGTLPARSIPQFVAQVFESGARTDEQLAGLIEECSDLSGAKISDEYFFDWGSDEPFSLAGRGPGECGAGVMDVIAVDIDKAKENLERCTSVGRDGADSQDLYEAVLASARALLVIFGLEPKTDRQVFEAFGRHLVEPGWVAPDSIELLNAAMEWRMGDRQSLSDWLDQAQTLGERVEQLFLSLDAGLKFRLDPIRPGGVGDSDGPSKKVDLRGVACPLNFVKAKLALEQVEIGRTLEILLDDGEPIRNVPASLTEQGHEIVEARKVGTHHVLQVVRKS